MQKGTRRLSVALFCAATVSFISWQQATAAPPSWNQAVADYNAGRYAQALFEFNQYKATYPTYPLVHYYLALCHQAMNHIGEARAEFDWVAQHGDARLGGMARAGAQQLSHLSTTSGGSSAPSTTTAPEAAAQTKVAARVKKIIEFYADW